MEKEHEIVLVPYGDIEFYSSKPDEIELLPKEMRNNELIYIKDNRVVYLYVLSDEKIQQNDWCLKTDGNIYQYDIDIHNKVNSKIFGRKIIATNNPLLNKVIPGLSIKFIKEYVTRYNRDDIINTVWVNYTTVWKNRIKGLQPFPAEKEEDIIEVTEKPVTSVYNINPKYINIADVFLYKKETFK